VHNNYHFLRQLTRTLRETLNESVLSGCFSQNKDELILAFDTPDGAFFIKASVLPQISCLSFPRGFGRARKNSVDLFEGLTGQRVTGVRQYDNDRSFALNFTEHFDVIFKMHGTKANIILAKDGKVETIFRKQLVRDFALMPEKFDRTIDWSFEHFVAHHDRLRETYFTLGKVVWQYLEDKGFSALRKEDQWQLLTAVKQQLESGNYYLTHINDLPVLSLVPAGDIRDHFTDPVQAINAFFLDFVKSASFVREKKLALTALHNRRERINSSIAATAGRLRKISDDSRYRLWADLIMANLTQIPAGQSRVELPDLYHGDRAVQIKLKPALSPQKNAEMYYAKAKNQAIELTHLQRLLAAKEAEQKEIQAAIRDVEMAEDSKAVRSLAGKLSPSAPGRQEAATLPYHEHTVLGFRIWVGKNAAANDRLTTKHAYKEDLWLHARDVPGSHVIIKYQAGSTFPGTVIERAAQLAAFHSKRKNESLCPVIYTPRKFVRKRKGDAPGVVVVEREKVILVVPSKQV
jgi:predicted ribosome quality control (RQC) complex YloA/Tae2 family protein